MAVHYLGRELPNDEAESQGLGQERGQNKQFTKPINGTLRHTQDLTALVVRIT